MEIMIRTAQPRDFLRIAELDRNAWKDNAHSEYIPDGEYAWRLWVEHALVFCAEEDQKGIVGAILAFPSVHRIFCLHKVFVDKELRGRGIGSDLFAALLRELDKRRESAFLTVAPGNGAAIALYRKWGFEENAFVKGYYREEEDRFLFVRHPAGFDGSLTY